MKINYRAYFPSSKTCWHVYKLELRIKFSNSFKFIIVYIFFLDLNFISISRFLEIDKKIHIVHGIM